MRLTGNRWGSGQRNRTIASSKGGYNMKSLQKCLLAACFSFGPILLFAQSSGPTQNLDDCKAGREACDRSKLSTSEVADVALAQRARNLSNCRNGFDPCDRSKLTPREATALAVADHERDVSDCTSGMGSCDPSKLTPSEALDSSLARAPTQPRRLQGQNRRLRSFPTDSVGSHGSEHRQARTQLSPTVRMVRDSAITPGSLPRKAKK